MKKINKFFGKISIGLTLVAFATPIGLFAQNSGAKVNLANYDEVSAENLVVIETTKGQIIVALEPRIAQNHANRIRELVSEGFYDGIIFHRVIDGFMAQTGDPTGTGVGSSTKPDLEGEFIYRRNPQSSFTQGFEKDGLVYGWVGAIPVTTQTDALMYRTIDQSVKAWGNHCPAVTSMARSEEPNSANSQFFLMRKYSATLDQKYSVWGFAVKGLDTIRALKVIEPSDNGAPPAAADKMVKVTLASKIDAAARPRVFVEKSDSPIFQAKLEKTLAAKGDGFSNCDFGPDIQIIEPK